MKAMHDRHGTGWTPGHRLIAACATAAVLFGGTPAVFASGPSDDAQALDAAIAGDHRSEDNRARDRFRHPAETLRFFGIRPDMTVVEVIPGGGWYTEILAPYLHDDGRLIAASFPPGSPDPFFRRMAARFQEKLDGNPEVYGGVELQPFAPPDYVVLGPPQSADMVLTFRNTHDLVYANVHGGVTDAVIDAFFRAAYLALKPGGVLGVVAHRAHPDHAASESHELGRVPREYVVQAAQRSGFRLDAESDVNANPDDPRDIPVWYLPPSRRAPEGKQAEYDAIGESDRMTLRFVKPGA